MEFNIEDFGGIRFTVPDEPNVFQLVDYDSRRYEMPGMPSAVILWEMAKALIEEWECEALPDKDADLKEVTDSRAAYVVERVGVDVADYRRGLDKIPKNS